MEYCRDLQRSDGDSKPDCGVPVVGNGCEDGEGVFCYRRKINLFKRETPESQYEIQAFFICQGLVASHFSY